MQEWARLDKVTARAIFVGDYNRIGEGDPTLWNSFLAFTGCLDVDPKLLTYSSQTAASALDRCLIPTEWVTSAGWNPCVRTLQPASGNGHKILRIAMQLRPSVVNNPKDPKQEVLPSDLFMPGKHPNATKRSDIQALLRLHREMNQTSTCTTCYHSLMFANVQPKARSFQVSPKRGDYDVPDQEGDGLTRSSFSQVNRAHNLEQSGVREHTFKRFSLSSCFWAWWRTQEVPKANPAVTPHLLARKYLRGAQQWVNIPLWIVEDIIKQTRGAVI